MADGEQLATFTFKGWMYWHYFDVVSVKDEKNINVHKCIVNFVWEEKYFPPRGRCVPTPTLAGCGKEASTLSGETI